MVKNVKKCHDLTSAWILLNARAIYLSVREASSYVVITMLINKLFIAIFNINFKLCDRHIHPRQTVKRKN